MLRTKKTFIEFSGLGNRMTSIIRDDYINNIINNNIYINSIKRKRENNNNNNNRTLTVNNLNVSNEAIINGKLTTNDIVVSNGTLTINTGNLNVNKGTIKSSGQVTISDYRIKNNIEPLTDNYTIDSLRPVTYYNKNLQKNDIGLIAHELQDVYPELVFGEKDGEEIQSINYNGLIPIIIKEIQNLKKEIISVKK
jgi:adhesin HecA-like repeat protein